ncbi:MAG: hypothetical protein C0597_09050, partial [Marinilabiliales bacterium]
FVFEDSFGELWIGTAHGGLNKFNKTEQNFKRYQSNTQLRKNYGSRRAYCIGETSNGNLWIGTGDGLFKYIRSEDRFEVYRNNPNDKNSLGSNNIQALYIDNDIIWIGTKETGISTFDPKKETFKHFKYNTSDGYGLNDNSVLFILKDSYGIFWIGTYEGGLNRFNPKAGSFRYFTHDPNNSESISHNRIEYILEDASKNLWIATKGGGLNKLDLKPKKFYNLSFNPNVLNSLPQPSVMALEADSYGNIWIGTDGGGLSIYNPKEHTFTHLKEKIKKQSSTEIIEIRSILIDQEGIIWIGTLSNGLHRIELKNNEYDVINYKNIPNNSLSLSSNIINSIIEDKKGNIWIGTAHGLNKLHKADDPKKYTFKQYYQNPTDSVMYTDNFISSILLDNQDRFWIGSYLGGLFQFLPQEEKFINYTPSKTPNSEFKRDIHVITIFEDNNNHLWLGTESNGLIKYVPEENKFFEHAKNVELLDNIILGMLEDDMGNLWISTSRGLSRYSYWNKSLIHFTYRDGLEGEGFNRNACLKHSDGNMYFGSNSSLVYFNPLEVSNNPYPPKVVITDFKILNKSEWNQDLLKYTAIKTHNKPIKLSYKDYFFTIEFAALDFTSSLQNQYKYMLEGFDEDWIDAKNQRTATYTNLDHGTYTFKVKGSNNDEVWNENPTELEIRIIPPFYKSLWFLIIIIVLIVLLIAIYVRWREKNLIREKVMLEKKVEERTIEINLQKEELQSQAENLERINRELEGQQATLEKLVTERTSDLEVAKEKAEESDKLKSAFLANMSHEIRTPMNAIIGFSNLMDDVEIEKDQLSELTKLIKKNSNSLLTLIDDIIDISKIESEQLEIRERSCEIDKLFRDILLEFTDDIHSNDHITFKVSEEQLVNSLVINCDSYRLSQILRNLISNAIKFTEKGVIEFGYSLEFINSKKEIMFFVKDTGIGLSEEQQKQIFSRFTKIENNKQKIYRGAGLGLAITKSLVELMGGSISVESEINKGSLFYFNLPYKPVKSERTKQNATNKTHLKFNWSNKCVLIAEDEESNFKFLEMIIRKTAADIIWAKTGKQAINMVQENHIDLILMDIKMPEMDGLEAIKKIRSSNLQTPIVVQSAYAMPEDRNLSFEAGANDFISKPIGSERLLKIIDKHLNQQ